MCVCALPLCRYSVVVSPGVTLVRRLGLRPLGSLMRSYPQLASGQGRLKRCETHIMCETYACSRMLHILMSYLQLPPLQQSDMPSDDYSKGVVFYLREDSRRIVGVLTWNLFGKMDLARQVQCRNVAELSMDAKIINHVVM